MCRYYYSLVNPVFFVVHWNYLGKRIKFSTVAQAVEVGIVDGPIFPILEVGLLRRRFAGCRG